MENSFGIVFGEGYVPSSAGHKLNQVALHIIKQSSGVLNG
jgi:hypothetical protein